MLTVNERFSYLCNFMISQCHIMEDPNHSLFVLALIFLTHLELAEKWSRWAPVFTVCPAIRICLVL